MIRFEDLLDKVRAYNPDADIELLRRAYVFSALEHKGQVRHSGEPYLVHPLEVANLLADMKLDVVAIAAGLLHDVVEDTLTTDRAHRASFRRRRSRTSSRASPRSARSRSRRARSARPRTSARCCWRWSTTSASSSSSSPTACTTCGRCSHLPEERRERIAQETLDIYAPIANRLGHEQGQERARGAVVPVPRAAGLRGARGARSRRKRRATEGVIEELKTTITREARARRRSRSSQIDGRIKRLYSIYQKLKRQKIDLDQVYDFVALRIVTDSVKDCYAALGIIHQTWSPVPGRIKDFIAMPRPNGYQSLHTSVISERGLPFEVQIRTERDAPHRRGRHRRALEVQGRAASAPSATSSTSSWLRQLLEWQQEVRDPQEFLQQPEDRPLPRGGLHLHARAARSRRCRAAPRRSTSPTRSTPTSATSASARASTARWCRCGRA